MNFSKDINLKDIGSNFSNLGSSLSWLFVVLFFILLFFEALEINRSIQIILESNRIPVVATKQQGVKINFTNYENVIFRMGQSQSFKPSSEAVINPF